MNFKRDTIPYCRVRDGKILDAVCPRFNFDGTIAALYPEEEPLGKFKVPIPNLKIKLSSLVQRLYENLSLNAFVHEEVIIYFLWKALNVEFLPAVRSFKISTLKSWTMGEFMLVKDLIEPDWKESKKSYPDYEMEEETDDEKDLKKLDYSKCMTVLLFSTFGQRISKADYTTGMTYMIHLIETVKVLRHNPPFSQSAEEINKIKKDPNSYYTIRTNKTIKMFCSVLDYFLLHSASEETKTLRVSTITSRYEDQAGASSFLQLLEACPAETATIMSFIHSPELANEIDIIYVYPSFLNMDHFWPCSSCANLITKSAFSSIEMKNLYVMVAVYMGTIGQVSHFNKFLPNGNVDTAIAIGYHLAKQAVSAYAKTPQWVTTAPTEMAFLQAIINKKSDDPIARKKFDTELLKNLKFFYDRVEHKDSARLTTVELSAVRDSIINPREKSIGYYLKGIYSPYIEEVREERAEYPIADPEEIASNLEDEEFPAM